MNLEPIRKKIDIIDQQLISLLNNRIELALEIGKIKEEANMEVYAPAREKAVLDRVADINKGPINNASLKAIYREIMSAALALERPIAISYLGPPATFTHQAAREKFGASVDYLPVNSIEEVFTQVERGKTEYGVVPIENSVEGSVNYTLDVFMDSDIKICAELYLKITHALLSRFPKEHIKVIYSHPNVFGQCRGWIRDNFPGAKLIEVSSTSRAAETVNREPDSAAIASSVAGALYQIPILYEGIEDMSHNITRFLIIGKNDSKPSGQDKTSIMVSIKDRVGALYEMLQSFRDSGINLTKIESRPSKKKAWDYYFFIDFIGHHTEPHVSEALSRLSDTCETEKILGSYPVSSFDIV